MHADFERAHSRGICERLNTSAVFICTQNPETGDLKTQLQPRAPLKNATWSLSRFSATASWGVIWLTPESGNT